MVTLKQILHESGCSLVVRDSSGEVTTYDKKGVRDLMWLLDHAPLRLCGASIADKVIGKAAAGLVAVGGVRKLYAEVLSRKALPLLEEAGIAFSCGTLVEHIVIPVGDTRCPLEQIVAAARTPQEVEAMLRHHFTEMAARRAEG